jgi:hypothetical protein
MLPLKLFKDMSSDSNSPKPSKVGKKPLKIFSLKFKSFKLSIFPHAEINPSGIEFRWLLETSRCCKVSILQKTERDCEEREEPCRTILMTDELVLSQVTPFHEHGLEFLLGFQSE